MLAIRPYRSVIVALVAAASGLLWLAAPAVAKADTFAAIAYSDSTGRYGYSYGYSSRFDAENRALSECGTDDARVVIWGRNAYVALAVGDNGAIGYAWGSSESIARNIARQKCRDYGGQNVRIAVSVYSGD